MIRLLVLLALCCVFISCTSSLEQRGRRLFYIENQNEYKIELQENYFIYNKTEVKQGDFYFYVNSMDYTKIVFSATDEPYWSTNKEVIEVARSKSENPNVNRFSVFDPSRCVVFRIHEYIYDRKIISCG